MVAGNSISDDRVRLHITPFNRDLLNKLLPTSLQSQATDISFHDIRTFPERGFGYVELPAMEAQKLKKKLNGTTLKGSKVRVEEARPTKKRKGEQAERADDPKPTKKRKKERGSSENGVLLGHQLEEGRIVKRGWTEDANLKRVNKNKKVEKSVSLKDKKLRFKTAVPPNAVAVDTKAKKTAKTNKEDPPKRTRANTVVNEFSKSSRLIASKPSKKVKPSAFAYEEGKGWLDENGNVIEVEPPSRKRQWNLASLNLTQRENIESGSNSVPEPDLDVEMSTGPPPDNVQRATSLSSGTGSETSSSDSSSEDGSTSSSSEEENSSGASTLLSNDTTLPTTTSESHSTVKEIHPLEALYKRSKAAPDDPVSNKKPTPIDTSFSFFGTAEAGQIEIDEHERQLPQTPHTTKDLEWRSIRSAAPTPDTALPGKRFSFALEDDEEEEDEDDTDTNENDVHDKKSPTYAINSEAEVGLVHRKPNGESEESEFRRWFFDNRGDLNRGWKKRRREEKKLQRQRENRRLSRKVA